MAAALLTELIGVERANGGDGNLSAVPRSPLDYNTQFKPQANDLWLNGFWLVSLVLTLSIAVISGLVKQWLQFYVADVIGSPQDRACVRRFRFNGLSQWGVAFIIDLLPVIMNASILFFFAGLIRFSQGLTATTGISWSIGIVTCSCFAFYFASSILPLWFPQCPYRTSLSLVVHTCQRLILLIAGLRRRSVIPVSLPYQFMSVSTLGEVDSSNTPLFHSGFFEHQKRFRSVN
jgi:hypothetical protein